ncbi:MAG: thermonuclease family protein [Acidimicrobiales bacterium]
MDDDDDEGGDGSLEGVQVQGRAWRRRDVATGGAGRRHGRRVGGHGLSGTLAGLLIVSVVATVLIGVRALRPEGGDDRSADGRNATVVRVVDGDTVVVRVGGSEEPVRLIGIDTPESVAENQPVECYGPEASERLGQLLPPGTAVRLARDVEPRDRYDRLLAYVYRADDDLLVNQDQVTRGYAEASEYPPNTALSATFTAAQRSAQASDVGMWATC